MKWLFKAFREGHPAALSILLVVLTAGTFLGSLQNGFVNYDDPVYVYANRHVVSGLSWENIRWAFTSLEHFWHPVTWLSIMADCQLFGKQAWGHHLTSVALHTASTVLLFLLLRRLTGAPWRSFVVAALFAVHPLHVESVVWAAERKDVLSTFFGMLTLLAYAKYAGRLKSGSGNSAIRNPQSALGGPSTSWYVLSLVFFILGLMSKSMLVTLPVLMLLLDFWPLRRFGLSTLNSQLSTLLIEKLPFFAASVASGIITIIAQGQTGALQSAARLPVGYRVENAIFSYAAYLGQMVWPLRLAVFYSYPNKFALWAVVGLALAGLGITALVLWQARRRPYLAVGWAWYVITLLPVIGLLQVGSQARADRYTYLPLVGIFIALVWGAHELTYGWAAGRGSPPASAMPQSALRVAALLAILVVGACSFLSWRQIGYWKESETLFRHALALDQNNEVAHVNLGTALEAKARVLAQASVKVQDPTRQKALREEVARLEEEATQHFQEAVRVRPVFAVAQCDLGAALFRKGDLEQAIYHARKAVELKPDYAGAQYTLGAALGKAGYLDEALYHLQIAVRLAPTDPEARFNFGFALLNKGYTNAAVAQLREAKRLRKLSPNAQ